MKEMLLYFYHNLGIAGLNQAQKGIKGTLNCSGFRVTPLGYIYSRTALALRHRLVRSRQYFTRAKTLGFSRGFF